MTAPHGFIEKLAELCQSHKPFASVTLVEAIGSTPQDAGTKMLVEHTGLLFGTVGGGRIENKAIQYAQQLLQSNEGPVSVLVEWNLQRDIGMTCGGVAKLFFETYNHGVWQIAIFGAGHVAQALIRILIQLPCRVHCIDPREEWLARLPESSQLVTVQLAEPKDYVAQLADDCFVLCMTMGHRTDRPILEEIFQEDRHFPYLGVIGSRAKRKVLVAELKKAGCDTSRLDELRCPIGLDLGTNQPGEIAVSVAAELIQVRDSLKTPAKS